MKPIHESVQHVLEEMGVVSERLMLVDFTKYAKLVTEAYDELPVMDQSAVPAWKALEQSTEKLFKRMTSKVRVEFVDEDPYTDAADMTNKVKESGILKIWNGEAGHPIWSTEHNLRFRAVHDYLTHIIAGAPFGLRGELRAYNTHAKLVPPKAKPAIFTEVVGQVCSAIVTGSFPTQKVAIMEGFDYDRVGKVDGYQIDNKQLVRQQSFNQADSDETDQ